MYGVLLDLKLECSMKNKNLSHPSVTVIVTSVHRMTSKNDDITSTTAVVGDLTSFTQEQIAQTLANVDVSFTCRCCQVKKTTLQGLIDHMVKGSCMKSENHGDVKDVAPVSTQLDDAPSNYEGAQTLVRPDIETINAHTPSAEDLAGSATLDASADVEIIAVKPKSKRGRKKRKICHVDEEAEVSYMPTVPPRRHNTRCSTGAIKRINIAKLLGASMKLESEEPEEGTKKEKLKDDDDEEESRRTATQIKKEVGDAPKRGRGRPRKYPKVEQSSSVSVKEEDAVCDVEEDAVCDVDKPSAPVKARGRPRKEKPKEDNEVCKVEEPTTSKALLPYQPLWDLSTFLLNETKTSESCVDDIEHDDVQTDSPIEEQADTSTEETFGSPITSSCAEKDESVLSPAVRATDRIKRPNAGWKRPRTHRCNICKMRFFATLDELNLHLACHLEDAKDGDGVGVDVDKRDAYVCCECQYACAGWNRMLIHLVSHAELRTKLRNTSIVKNIIGVFRCPVCRKAFEKKGNMKGHYRKVHFKQNRVCEVCGKTLAGVDEKTFVRHVEKCKNVMIQCEFCDYKTTVTANFRKHYKVHTGEGFTCAVCLAVYPTRQRYEVHARTHAAVRPKSVCEFCGQEFLSEDAVRKHVQRFHVEHLVRYGCPQCQYIGKMETDLRKHVTSVHNKKFKCASCPYQTNSVSAFEQHHEYHQPDRIYVCPFNDQFNEQCFYRGATTKQLANHVSQVHKIGSRHQCPICQKFYKKKTHLLRHLVSHTKEKPYVCLECGTAFMNHSSYYRHRRKTGHDKKREGVVSVPQNITIQYLAAEEVVEVTTSMSPKVDDPSNANQQVALAPSHAAFMQDVANAEEVLRHEQGGATEQVLLFDSSMFQLAPSSMADLANAITVEPLTEEVHTEATDGSTEGTTQEVTYILKVAGDDAEYETSTEVVETLPASASAPEQLQEVVYKEANSCGVQTTIVEVAAPGGDDPDEHRYVILMCNSGDEPEAALSMLQLQSTVQ